MKALNCLEGSAWHTWQCAGEDWANKTYATSEGAITVAAACFASKGDGENQRGAMRRAFKEGARETLRKRKGTA